MKVSDLKEYTVVGNSEFLSSAPEKKKTLAQRILDAGTSVSKFVGAEGIAEQYGASIARTTLKMQGNEAAANLVENPSLKKVVGSAIQTGANFIPGAGTGASLGTKVAIGAATGYAFDVGSDMQANKSTGEVLTPGIGTAVGGGLPLVGAALKPVKAIVGRLFKGIGSGLSGVSTNSIDEIINNPKKAIEVSKKLAETGNDKVLEDNARTIINGVSKVRQEASKAYGEGLEQLSKVDIEPTVFRNQTQQTLDKYGVSLRDGVRTLGNVEFDDPKNIQKASDLIDKLSKVELDGKSIRKLSDDIENAAYKVATSDERLSFNSFVRDLSNTLKDAVTQSTSKLDDINKAYSQDLQLTESVEDIFGKVNFKNLPEVLRASKKLETVFSQKGLAPSIVDDFLTRIGVSPNDFKTSEAVRQISNKTTGANTKGLSLGELIQQATSAIVTPNAVKNMSILTGLAEDVLSPFLEKMKPAARNVVIQALLQVNQGDSK